MEKMPIEGRERARSCRFCRSCDGAACAGEIPGLGGKGNGRSFINNYQDLKRVRLVQGPIGRDTGCETGTELFGLKVTLPVYGAPMGGIAPQFGAEMTDAQYAEELLAGCIAAGTIGFTGDGKDPEYFRGPVEVIARQGGRGIPTVKPWERKGLDQRIEALKGKPILALATDIDACGLLFLRNADPRITSFSVEDIRYLKARAGVPLIIKGIMKAEDAEKAVGAGADGIVVSNHGGRVLDDEPGTISALPEITKAVKGNTVILIDGGFRSGTDVFKALALGADGVLIGRPLALRAICQGRQAVSDYLNKIRTELQESMLLCGAHDLTDITPEMIRIAEK